MGSTWYNKYSKSYISKREESHREEKIKLPKPTQYAVVWEVALVSGKDGVERWVPKLGEKIPEESYEDQKAKVNGFFWRCLQSRKEKQSL